MNLKLTGSSSTSGSFNGQISNLYFVAKVGLGDKYGENVKHTTLMLFILLAETRISKIISNMVALRSCEEGLLRYQYHYDDQRYLF